VSVSFCGGSGNFSPQAEMKKANGKRQKEIFKSIVLILINSIRYLSNRQTRERF
jgi:hypothetical protein